jgi:biopolymer transport protein ExbD
MGQKVRRTVKLFSSIDSTVLTSILVVIAIVIIVARSVESGQHHATSVDLPRVSHPVSIPNLLREDAMQVFVTRDGQIFFRADRFSPDSLTEEIRDRLKNRGIERKVYIKADMRARYDSVEQVLDAVRAAGVLKVAFVVDQGRPIFGVRRP